LLLSENVIPSELANAIPSEKISLKRSPKAIAKSLVMLNASEIRLKSGFLISSLIMISKSLATGIC
jgi:hypothetical protein